MTSRSDLPFWRTRDGKGRQLVVVDGYTWAWDGTPDLAVGDDVELPGNAFTGGRPYRGTVTRLGSDYLGSIRAITGRCPPTSRLLTFDEIAEQEDDRAYREGR
jgi:hypothetical protein